MKNKRPLIGVVEGYSVGRPLEIAGAEVFTINDQDDMDVALPLLDGIVFTGGGDVNPELYGEVDIHKEVYGVNKRRDDLEYPAMQKAMAAGIAIMGICRGSQLINVAHGGTLHQHLPEVNGGHDHFGIVHGVKLTRRSRLAKALSRPYLHDVSSFHHQSVRHLGDGLTPIGWANDGTIEAVETLPSLNHYALGLQFHPEMDYRTDKDALAIFKHFVAMSMGRYSGPLTTEERNDKILETVYSSLTAKWDYTRGWRSQEVYGSESTDGFRGRRELELGWEAEYDDEVRAADLWWEENGGNVTGQLPTWMDDDSIEYDEWLRLNDAGLRANESGVERQESCDAKCAFPPCTSPDLCDPDEGDCFRMRVAEGVASSRDESCSVDAELIAANKRGSRRGKGKKGHR